MMARSALIAAAGLAALLVVSCQTLSGSGASGAEFAASRQKLIETRTSMDKAAQDGDLSAVGKAMGEIGTQFDAIESRGSSMNIMDLESMKIQMATGRHAITETDRWIQVNDAEAVRNQVAQLDPILDEIDGLLDRAVKSSVPEGSETK